ncbi:cyclin-like protein [Bisporella sp. PMI_857]|nr:cyclin-like protein [Bisporella sp. PMI_857]
MTAVERYRLLQLSDVPPNSSRNVRNASPKYLVPPAVPSPPPARDSPPPRRSQVYQTPVPVNMASEDLGQWLFTDNELANTPSIYHGLSVTEERARRAKGVNFILQAGMLLKLPQTTLATASVFFHRFYMRCSMVVEQGGLHHYNIAATALFLATKTEENCRKTKEIVIAVAKVAQKNASLIIDEQSKEYWRWRDSILLYEEVMLEQLTFDVVLQSPYNYLFEFVPKLGMAENKHIRDTAWAFLNDSCLTIMCLRLKPRDIAIAAIYFSLKYVKEHVPDSEDGLPWWEELKGSADLIAKAVHIMNEFYTENPLRRSDNPYSGSPGSNMEADINSTRAVFSINTPEYTQNGQSPVNGSNGINGIKDTASQDLDKSLRSENGSSDAHLKEAANDPATHEKTGSSNGASRVISSENNLHSRNYSLKRKNSEDSSGAAANKLAKLSSEASKPSADGPTFTAISPGSEEGEEGEVEE